MPRTRRIPLGVCAVLLMPAVVAAEDPPPAPEEEKPRYFTLDRLDAYLETESQYNQTRVRYDNRGQYGGDYTQTNRDWQVQERIGFRLSGTVIDPGFVTYHTSVSFALTQDHYDEDRPFFEQNDSDWGHLLNYDGRINLFSGKPLSGTVYALRVDDRIPRSFQPTLDERRTGFGTSWYFAHDTLPMELSYDYLETDRTGNTSRADNEHYTDSTLHYGLQWLLSEHHRFKMSYDHSNDKQNYEGTRQGFETTQDLWIFEHELEFGAEHQHELRTLVHWQEESGDFARDLFELGPQLTLRHSDNFQTMYKYQFNREDYEQYRVTQHRGEFQFVHQLYSNLTTTGTAFGLWEHVSDDVETTQYGASVDWQYNRGNPLGHFYANLRVGFDNEHVNGDDGERVILNESATFIDPVAVTLRNQNIIPYSIIVTDATNRRILRPFIDYLVYRQGTWTRMTRVPTGVIADGDTVLVDYVYRTPDGGDVNTLRVDYSAEQRFEGGLTPYYRFSYRNQDVKESVGFPVSADRTDHHRMGVRYEQDRYTLSGEFEIFDDSIDPYYGYHFDGRCTLLHNSAHSLESAARFSRLFFDSSDYDRDVSLLDLELDHRWQISEGLSAASRVAWRFQDDSEDGDTNGLDLSSELSYAVGDLSVALSVEYDILDLPDSKEDGFGVWLSVRRDIPDLIARR